MGTCGNKLGGTFDTQHVNNNTRQKHVLSHNIQDTIMNTYAH
jgi:hypothetical protein